jgi:histidine ammonia-lyase
VLRKQVPALGSDRYMADDIAKSTALVEAGTLQDAAASVLASNPFPNLVEKGHLS